MFRCRRVSKATQSFVTCTLEKEGPRCEVLYSPLSPEVRETLQRRSIADRLLAFGLHRSLRYTVLSGKDSPGRRMFWGSYPSVTYVFHQKSTSAHPLLCSKQDLLSALGGGLPESLRPTEKPVWQRSGPAVTEEWVATRKTTGDLATRRGASDPERRAEWMTVLRYGHLRSAPVVVNVALRTE